MAKKKYRIKVPKTDKQGRIVCRTALSADVYNGLLKIYQNHDRSIAYLLRQGAKEVIEKYNLA